MELIEKYFSPLSKEQKERFFRISELYAEHNKFVNVISRKDIPNIIERHVLHSLGIAKVCTFPKGAKVLDVGTGGGFPGIPLAILFPDTQFHLVDSIQKKIRVVDTICRELGLTNVQADVARVENLKQEYDYFVSRAVTSFPVFVKWIKNKVNKPSKYAMPNGILYLKGGDLREELKDFGTRVELFELSDYFEEEFFETKKVVYLPL